MEMAIIGSLVIVLVLLIAILILIFLKFGKVDQRIESLHSKNEDILRELKQLESTYPMSLKQ